MDLQLQGRSALVTGGSKGIGLAVAHTLAAEGCRVHLVARTAADLDAARAAIYERHGAEAGTWALDLSRSEAVTQLVDACPDVDILVNNAGAIPGGDLQAIDEERWREAWDLKVFGYINLCRAYYARMKARGSGAIINVIGQAGEYPSAGYVAGSAGNAALMAFTRALGSGSLDDGVRVLGVNPGLTETDRMVTLLRKRAEDDHGDPERWREYLARQPLGRAARAEEVGDLVAFLASPRVTYLNGTIVTINGGRA